MRHFLPHAGNVKRYMDTQHRRDILLQFLPQPAQLFRQDPAGGVIHHQNFQICKTDCVHQGVPAAEKRHQPFCRPLPPKLQVTPGKAFIMPIVIAGNVIAGNGGFLHNAVQDLHPFFRGETDHISGKKCRFRIFVRSVLQHSIQHPFHGVMPLCHPAGILPVNIAPFIIMSTVPVRKKSNAHRPFQAGICHRKQSIRPAGERSQTHFQ